MSEEINPGYGKKIKAEAWRVYQRLRHRVKQKSIENDPLYPVISEKLDELARTILPILQSGELPKVLTIPHHGETFVSYRRVQGTQLDTYFRVTNQKESEWDARHLEIILNSQQFPDKNLAVLTYPSYPYKCRDPEVVNAIIKRVGEQKYVEEYDATPWDAMMMKAQDLYKEEDWTTSSNSAEIALRVGKSVYSKFLNPDREYTLNANREIFPLIGEQVVPLHHQIFLDPNTEVDATMALYRQHATLYLLDKGTVEKQKDLIPETSGEVSYTPLAM